MGTTMIKADTFAVLERLQKEFPNKSPYIFGKRNAFGFDKLNFKTFEADEETIVPGAMCINEEILNLLAEYNVVLNIDGYMATSNRPPAIGPSRIYRSMAMVLMLSCVKYSFNGDTFPYLKNADINQMWADAEQMAKGNHAVCDVVSAAVRGRSHEGFTRHHAVRCQVPPVSILDVPKFGTHARLLPARQPPPPPPPRKQPPPPPPREKTPEVPEGISLPKSFSLE